MMALILNSFGGSMHTDFYLLFLGFLILGMFSGIFSGLMGAGGGLVTVPGLVFLLNRYHVDSAIVMHVAVGTTLAKMMCVATRSLLSHAKRQVQFFDIYKQMAPGLVFGILFGSVTAHFLHSYVLRVLFGVYVLYLAVALLVGRKKSQRKPLPGRFGMLLAGSFVGFQSGMFGIGGSAFTIPFLTGRGVCIRKAVVVSVAFAATVATLGTVAYIVTGLHAARLPAWSTGYIYWPAWLGLTVGGLAMAPLGVRLSHYLSPQTLKLVFVFFLILIGLHMLGPLLLSL